ncbi:DNA repair protein RecO [Bifidobacterium simiarum]|uniref:DNA repair protein RecO n=1 Tax=Bifidobacterium simiarum TaxID=2045441 RepID=A0A2M9HH40_9BIFI|nr:DNA repair protein RecO [Bifidobacterium simiarum]PJM76140.1 DNA repair protein RecO [Bifidobacterium simiarum]
MPLYRDEGLVLRTTKLGEADGIVTILTRDHGKVRAVAKGVRRMKTRFGGRLEPFMRVDLLIATGRSLDVISQASTVSAYADPLIADYDRYLAANVIGETADKLFSTLDEPSPEQYRLAVGAISALARHLHGVQDVTDSYMLRSLALAGWRPRLDSCVVCGLPVQDPVSGPVLGDGEPETAWFLSIPAGGVMCAADRTPEARRISLRRIERLRALLEGDWRALERSSEKPGQTGAGSDGGRQAGANSAVAVPAAPGATVPDAAASGAAVPGIVDRTVEEWAEYYLERPIRSARLLD